MEPIHSLYLRERFKKLGVTHAVIELAESYSPEVRGMLRKFYTYLNKGGITLHEEYVKCVSRNPLLPLSEKEFSISPTFLLLGIWCLLFEAHTLGRVLAFLKGTSLIQSLETEYAYRKFLRKPAN